eukprot:TRINITY_DN7044_c0_g1_i1.p1 TRINITY_DN7044_c0_g1~~TRINITY_DN7044_c0_g1_i1.p1  ORF type:complete len:493 (+),score=149.24 TRINITY_DN7044_c0_g1_i1:532-2010(+)
MPPKAKSKAKNPLAFLKAKKAEEAQADEKRQAQQQQAKAEGTLQSFDKVAAAPPVSIPSQSAQQLPQRLPPREYRTVAPNTPILAPTFCKPRTGRDQKAVARLRPGVTVNDRLKEPLEISPEKCDDTLLAQLIQTRLDNSRDSNAHICVFEGSDASAFQRMNMDGDLTAACIGMMERFDFTYGSLCSVKDIDRSAASLTCLCAIEPYDGINVVSHAFCLVYCLFMLRMSANKVRALLHRGCTQSRALALIYMRYTLSASDFLDRCGRALVDDTELLLREGHDVSEKDETMQIQHFTERLLCDTDFLEAAFPAYTQEEQSYIAQALPVLKVKRAAKAAEQDAARKAHEAIPLEERQKAAQEKKAAAEEERTELIKRTKMSALLPGFSDIGTQINWLTYNTYVQNANAAALAEDMRKRDEALAQERELEEARKAKSAEQKPEFTPVTSLDLDKGKKRSSQASAARPKKKKRTETKKVAAARLEKEAASYLPEEF